MRSEQKVVKSAAANEFEKIHAFSIEPRSILAELIRTTARYTRSIPLILVGLFLALAPIASAPNPTQATEDARAVTDGTSFESAQALFYNGYYDSSAALTLELIRSEPDNLKAYELRTSALLFQIKRLLGDGADKNAALRKCDRCDALIAAFQHDTASGLTQARAQLKADPLDDNAEFMVGKLDLNHVWLYLGTLGRRTGWNEYWEARHSLDAVLERNPRHLRARLARAWIDYIVETRMTWGTRWILGGGNKKKALATMRETAAGGGEFYTSAEARFALWDVQVREKNISGAVVTARSLAIDFPHNAELTRFVATNGPALRSK